MNIEHNHLIDVYIGSPTPDAIECSSVIPTWAPIFEGHFPEHPILPGALMVEMMAQAGSFLCMLKSSFAHQTRLVAVKTAKFKGYGRAGEGLLIRAQAAHWGDGAMACEANVVGDDGRPLANATLTLKFQPLGTDRMRSDFMTLLSGGRPGPLRYSTQSSSSTKECMA
jgi:3-hydroxymyristoyl/3-hydroxydecanoyl-(acyl carrier protein) dehydratase